MGKKLGGWDINSGDLISQITETIMNAVEKKKESVEDAGKELIDSLGKGIEKGTDDVVETVKMSRKEITKEFQRLNRSMSSSKTGLKTMQQNLVILKKIKNEYNEEYKSLYDQHFSGKFQNVNAVINGEAVSGLDEILKKVNEVDGSLQSINYDIIDGKISRHIEILEKQANAVENAAEKGAKGIKRLQRAEDELGKQREREKRTRKNKEKIEQTPVQTQESTLTTSDPKDIEESRQKVTELASAASRSSDNLNAAAGAMNNLGAAAEKAGKKIAEAFDINKAIKKYNSIMTNIGYDENTIGMMQSQDTNSWGLKEMLDNAQSILNTFYDENHVNFELKSENLSAWRSETAQLRNFIKTYSQYLSIEKEITDESANQTDEVKNLTRAEIELAQARLKLISGKLTDKQSKEIRESDLENARNKNNTLYKSFYDERDAAINDITKDFSDIGFGMPGGSSEIQSRLDALQTKLDGIKGSASEAEAALIEARKAISEFGGSTFTSALDYINAIKENWNSGNKAKSAKLYEQYRLNFPTGKFNVGKALGEDFIKEFPVNLVLANREMMKLSENLAKVEANSGVFFAYNSLLQSQNQGQSLLKIRLDEESKAAREATIQAERLAKAQKELATNDVSTALNNLNNKISAYNKQLDTYNTAVDEKNRVQDLDSFENEPWFNDYNSPVDYIMKVLVKNITDADNELQLLKIDLKEAVRVYRELGGQEPLDLIDDKLFKKEDYSPIDQIEHTTDVTKKFTNANIKTYEQLIEILKEYQRISKNIKDPFNVPKPELLENLDNLYERMIDNGDIRGTNSQQLKELGKIVNQRVRYNDIIRKAWLDGEDSIEYNGEIIETDEDSYEYDFNRVKMLTLLYIKMGGAIDKLSKKSQEFINYHMLASDIEEANVQYEENRKTLIENNNAIADRIKLLREMLGFKEDADSLPLGIALFELTHGGNLEEIARSIANVIGLTSQDTTVTEQVTNVTKKLTDANNELAESYERVKEAAKNSTNGLSGADVAAILKYYKALLNAPQDNEIVKEQKRLVEEAYKGVLPTEVLSTVRYSDDSGILKAGNTHLMSSIFNKGTFDKQLDAYMSNILATTIDWNKALDPIVDKTQTQTEELKKQEKTIADFIQRFGDIAKATKLADKDFADKFGDIAEGVTGVNPTISVEEGLNALESRYEAFKKEQEEIAEKNKRVTREIDILNKAFKDQWETLSQNAALMDIYASILDDIRSENLTGADAIIVMNDAIKHQNKLLAKQSGSTGAPEPPKQITAPTQNNGQEELNAYLEGASNNSNELNNSLEQGNNLLEERAQVIDSKLTDNDMGKIFANTGVDELFKKYDLDKADFEDDLINIAKAMFSNTPVDYDDLIEALAQKMGEAATIQEENYEKTAYKGFRDYIQKGFYIQTNQQELNELKDALPKNQFDAFRKSHLVTKTDKNYSLAWDAGKMLEVLQEEGFGGLIKAEESDSNQDILIAIAKAVIKAKQTSRQKNTIERGLSNSEISDLENELQGLFIWGNGENSTVLANGNALIAAQKNIASATNGASDAMRGQETLAKRTAAAMKKLADASNEAADAEENVAMPIGEGLNEDTAIRIVSESKKPTLSAEKFNNVETSDDVRDRLAQVIDEVQKQNLTLISSSVKNVLDNNGKGVLKFVNDTLDKLYTQEWEVINGELKLVSEKFDEKYKTNTNDFDPEIIRKNAISYVGTERAKLYGLEDVDDLNQKLDELETKAKNINNALDFKNFKIELGTIRNEITAAKKASVSQNSIDNAFANMQKHMKNAKDEIISCRNELAKFGDTKGVDAASAAIDKMAEAEEKYNQAQERSAKKEAAQDYFNALNEYKSKVKLINSESGLKTKDSLVTDFNGYKNSLKNLGLVSDEARKKLDELDKAIQKVSPDNHREIVSLSNQFEDLKKAITAETSSNDFKNRAKATVDSLKQAKAEIKNALSQIGEGDALAQTDQFKALESQAEAVIAKIDEYIKGSGGITATAQEEIPALMKSTEEIKRKAQAISDMNELIKQSNATDTNDTVFDSLPDSYNEGIRNISKITDPDKARQETDFYETLLGDAQTAREEMRVREEDIKNYYNRLMSLSKNANLIDKKMNDLNLSNTYGQNDKLITDLQEQKNRVFTEANEIRNALFEIFSGGFQQGVEYNIPTLNGTVFEDFFNDVRVQAVLTTEQIEKFIGVCDEAKNIDLEFSSKFLEKQGQFNADSKRVNNLIQSGSVDFGSGILKNAKYYNDEIQKIYAKYNTNDPRVNKKFSNWDPEDLRKLSQYIDEYSKCIDDIEKIALREQQYFSGKTEFVGVDTIEKIKVDTEQASSKTEATKKILTDAAKEMTDGQAIITKFTQSANGISKLDFSVLDKATNSMRAFSLEMGTATDKIYATENTIKNMASGTDTAVKQLNSLSNTMSKMDAEDLNNSSEYEKLKNIREELSKAASSGNETDMAKYSAEAKLAIANAEKLFKIHLQLQDAISSNDALKIGSGISANGNIYTQMLNSVQEFGRAFADSELKIGNFNAKTNTLTFTLTNADGQVKTMKASLDALNGTVVASETGVKQLGSTWDIIKNSFGNGAKQLMGAIAGGSLIYKGISQIRQGVSYVKALDSAMTELRKVTDATEATYKKFLQTASGVSAEIGSTVTDFTTATADFARLGYSIADATELAKAATVYKNVGDGIDSISQASESIISTMKAFGIETEGAMRIVDKFNEVGNNFSISSTGIGDALQRSASALMEAGNTLDESIALITAANSVIQNPDQVGKTPADYKVA